MSYKRLKYITILINIAAFLHKRCRSFYLKYLPKIGTDGSIKNPISGIASDLNFRQLLR